MKQIFAACHLFFLLGLISLAVARPLDSRKFSDVTSQRDLELRDLSAEGTSPVERIKGKKHMKNASGKSDEGGYYKTYGSDAEGEKGYVRQKYSNGDHGYKSHDTFHKKAGDNYGFEEHEIFGKESAGARGSKGRQSKAYKAKASDDDHEGAGTEADSYYAEEEEEDDGENAAYTADGEGGDASVESASYRDGGDGEHYEDDGDAAHYSEGGSDSGNYGNSDGYNEHYSSGGGDEGSYGSYTSGDGYSFDGGDYY